MANRLSPNRLRAVSDLLLPPGIVAPDAEGPKAYMVIDAARRPGIHLTLSARAEELPIRSIYQGEMAENLADVCPYLVALAPGVPFTEYLIDQGWGDAWGIFVQSTVDFDTMRRHLRRFTVVNAEDGRTLLFRFYDPRVLSAFLPTCDGEQLAALFRDVDRYLMEDATGAQLLHFELTDGTLRTIRHPVRE